MTDQTPNTGVLRGGSGAVMRPGIRTSEFWLVLATVVIGALNKKLELGLDNETITVLAAGAASYAISRGLAKRT